MDKCEWPGKKGRPHRGRPFYIYSISKPLAAGNTWTALTAGPVFRPSGGPTGEKGVRRKERESNE